MSTTLHELVNEGAERLRRAGGTARESPRREAGLLLQAAAGVDSTTLLARGEEAVEAEPARRYREMVRRRAEGNPAPAPRGDRRVSRGGASRPGRGLHSPAGNRAPRGGGARRDRRTARRAVVRPGPRSRPPPPRSRRPFSFSISAPAPARSPSRSPRPSGRILRCRSSRGTGASKPSSWRGRTPLETACRSTSADRISSRASRTSSGPARSSSPTRPTWPPRRLRVCPWRCSGTPRTPSSTTGADRAFSGRIAAGAGRYLRKGGLLALEIGETQGPEVARCLREVGFSDVEVRPDLSGRDRIVRGRWPGRDPASGGGRKSTRSSCEAEGR